MSVTFDTLMAECSDYRGWGYSTKYLHVIPHAPVVDRLHYLLAACRDKTVLSLGCTGTAQDAIDGVVTRCYGIDIEPQDRPDFILCDLDDEPDMLRALSNVSEDIELIVAAEVLEHLANPGNVLKALRRFACPLLVTAPNAFWPIGLAWMRQSTENVNCNHVAYYSYWTLRWLLERYKYEVVEFNWCNGTPLFAEGLIMLAS